ncbi:DNA polymerase IV [Pseudarthrobacter sp. P1]|uniref:DNA polymerase IV n=1 Tax=Pseudarthrobacter sp. P1 TaxID=3418418 RepID=UPI003CEA63CB
MDAFFVSVELREARHLRGRPVIVGFPAGRSVVLSASYEARAVGVRSAMPMSTAMRLCPRAVVIEPRHSVYYEVSGQLMGIFNSITDLVEPLSVDEAFLDVAGAVRRLGSPEEIGALIRARVASELGITASVGIAASKFVAKIASTRCKPDGLLLIRPEDTVAYLHTLPVRALWGVGEKTMATLARLGIHTVADVAATPLPVLRKVLGATGEHVHRLSWGIDDRAVTPVRVEKSIGAEETFAVDTPDTAILRRELLRLAHRTATRLRASGLLARTVALKVRYADFSLVNRSRTLGTPVDSAALIYAAAVALLDGLGQRPMSVRLIGLRAEGLEPVAETALQLSLDRRDDNWRGADAVADAVAAKFGGAKIGPARLLGSNTARRLQPPGTGG